MINNTNIIIADDMEPILLYLEKVISNVPEFKLVGMAKNGKELIELVSNSRPELVITDLEMPEYNGIEAIEELNKRNIKTKYILITGNYDYIISSDIKTLGIEKVIKKPILDDKKFIEQIKEVIQRKDIDNNLKIEQ